ncbi:DUF7033 domain-containing protein [Hymenobacter metallilatus]|uniref:DUF7033 domain-containing protein n=1 Tax=Hymenobacter metallilatus TaxID=2493666 RepID=A0A3R9LVF7_9BACT|nr:hypothetical protein [Hymenobacter metallilatus]RSK24745.1 hypothetical protein EI290_19005 [Hymenobacter metallilatus]
MLPPLPPVPATTAETRLAYVLQHFWQAYDAVPTVSIGYADTQPQVEVAAVNHNFFADTAPYPAPPVWREWQDRTLPFFFDDQPTQPLLELLPGGQARIHADVVSAAFYLLSGWQEFHSDERDQHGRFPYAASVQQRYDFVTVPVVNYYFEVLRAAVEHTGGQPLRPRRWADGRAWAAFITHDIDNLCSAWKAPAKAALRRRDWLDFARCYWQHLTQKDAWDNLAEVQQTVAEYGASSTFFFLPEHRKAANGTPNADYQYRRITAALRPLLKTRSGIELHGSLGSCVNANKLHQDAEQICHLGPTGLGLRFHYLSWEPRITPMLVDELQFAYDSTLGFAEHYGFRNSYCLPFRPFNFQRGEAVDFLEIPLNVMDATLHHPRYLQLAPDEILPALTPMFHEIERFGGVCTVLWHNENFDPANTRNGPREFRALMEYLRSRNAAFVNGQDICTSMSALSS